MWLVISNLLLIKFLIAQILIHPPLSISTRWKDTVTHVGEEQSRERDTVTHVKVERYSDSKGDTLETTLSEQPCEGTYKELDPCFMFKLNL